MCRPAGANRLPGAQPAAVVATLSGTAPACWRVAASPSANPVGARSNCTKEVLTMRPRFNAATNRAGPGGRRRADTDDSRLGVRADRAHAGSPASGTQARRSSHSIAAARSVRRSGDGRRRARRRAMPAGGSRSSSRAPAASWRDVASTTIHGRRPVPVLGSRCGIRACVRVAGGDRVAAARERTPRRRAEVAPSAPQAGPRDARGSRSRRVGSTPLGGHGRQRPRPAAAWSRPARRRSQARYGRILADARHTPHRWPRRLRPALRARSDRRRTSCGSGSPATG